MKYDLQYGVISMKFGVYDVEHRGRAQGLRVSGRFTGLLVRIVGFSYRGGVFVVVVVLIRRVILQVLEKVCCFIWVLFMSNRGLLASRWVADSMV